MRISYLLILVLFIHLVSCQGDKKETPRDNMGHEYVDLVMDIDLNIYPKPTDQLERHVIYLDKRDNEQLYKIQFYVGKEMQVDCNNHWLAGEYKKEIVQGWGYPYYNFETTGRVMSSLMGCPDDTKRKLFVQAGGQMVRYNSNLPIVIYTPKGYEVRYHVWTQDTMVKKAVVE